MNYILEHDDVIYFSPPFLYSKSQEFILALVIFYVFYSSNLQNKKILKALIE